MLSKASPIIYSQIGIDEMVSSEIRVGTGSNFFKEKKKNVEKNIENKMDMFSALQFLHFTNVIFL